jgi:hypothetical protein
MGEQYKVDLKKQDVKHADWIHLAQDRHQWRALVNGNKPSDSLRDKDFLD